jgi:leucyl/phenylalanyl-tRNA--protein transferase
MLEVATRWTLGVAYACRPKRLPLLPRFLVACGIDLLRGGTPLPSRHAALSPPDTFGGVATYVTPERIVEAARRGFFAWSHVGPLKWWTRAQRMVMNPSGIHISKTTRQLMRKNVYSVTFDDAFDDVIRACARSRRGSSLGLTWITPRIMHLFARLHDAGYAHSFEVWNRKGELVGGGYGLAIGRVFVTESMFSLESNTSKLGFIALNHHLAKWGFVLNDGKDWARNLEDAGMALMPRASYEAILDQHARGADRIGHWRVEADLAEIADHMPRHAAPGRVCA